MIIVIYDIAAAPPDTMAVEYVCTVSDSDLLPVPMTMLPALDRVAPKRDPRLESLLLKRRSNSRLI